MNRNKKVILIVCRGNIARSPVAEFFLNDEFKKRILDEKLVAESRGIQGTWVDPKPAKFSNISFYTDLYREAKPALDKLKINISEHISKPITFNDAKRASLILAVDKKTESAILKLFPDLSDKLCLLSELVNSDEDFSDPENLFGTEKHLKVFQGIKDTIEKGFPKLMDLIK